MTEEEEFRSIGLGLSFLPRKITIKMEKDGGQPFCIKTCLDIYRHSFASAKPDIFVSNSHSSDLGNRPCIGKIENTGEKAVTKRP